MSSKTICLLLYTLFSGAFFGSCNATGVRASEGSIGDTVAEMHPAIWVIFQDKAGDFWYGSDGNGVYRYNGENLINYTSDHGLPNDRIREIKQDSKGLIYINTLGGVSKFDGTSFTTLPVVENDSLNPNQWKKEPGDLWFKGVFSNRYDVLRYDGRSLYYLSFPKNSLFSDKFYKEFNYDIASPHGVYFIYEDKQSNLWFGTAAAGVCRFDGTNVSWLYEDHLNYTPEGGSFGIRSILQDRKGHFWFCNNSYRYEINSGVVYTPNDLLVYKRERGIDNLKAPNGADKIYFSSIIEDKGGDLWMLTWSYGVWRYDGKKVTHYPVKKDGFDVKLVCMYKDQKEQLWIGTAEDGVYKFNGKSFEKFDPLKQI